MSKMYKQLKVEADTHDAFMKAISMFHVQTGRKINVTEFLSMLLDLSMEEGELREKR